MRDHFGKRIVLALLMLTIFCSYLYLEIEGYQELRLPGETELSLPVKSARTAAPGEQPASPAGREEQGKITLGLPSGGGTAAAAESGPVIAASEGTSLSAPPEIQPEPTVDPDSPYGKALAKAAELGLPTPPDVDISSWEFTLVNGDHSIDRYEPEQLAYLNQTLSETDIQTGYNGNRCPVDLRIAEPLIAMGLGCKEAGLPIFLSSGYRSYNDQAANFQRICQNNGVTDGKDGAGHYITMPAGCSEHQLALCCDITDRYYQVKSASIVQSPTVEWLLANCADYGFVQRFPAGKEDVTGVMNETWHFRYVGVEAARYMTDNHLVLEEFLGLYGVE